MTELNRAGEANSLGHIDTTQATFRQQIDQLTDTVRQISGHPNVKPGPPNTNNGDPLSAPYVLYVDPNIGRDTFVAGDYVGTDDGTYESKMRRISLQRLECGYSVSRPFRTINRALIEAGIITSRDYLNLSPAPCGDLVSIVMSPGLMTVLNDPGAVSTTPWSSGDEPDDAELIKFNPETTGGLVLPRGVSLISMDLRKTILRPNFVPAPSDEAADYSNRRAIFKTSGGCYLYGFTLFDKEGSTSSHHLLSAFEYASKADLDQFYAKIVSSFSGVAGINDDYAVTRDKEYQIVGPRPSDPDITVDTTRGSSPYVFNISIRSELGMCGFFADGAVNTGFKSANIAQFTGISLQKDLTSWERYSGGTWGEVPDYDTYISTNPDDLRMKPLRRSFHVRAVNKAVIQEVSVFAIGQGIHHWSQNGGELTITNSNSNFGGASALAEGYNDTAAINDSSWTTTRIRVATDLSENVGNVRDIFLGTVDAGVANDATTITLTEALAAGTFDNTIPQILERLSYSLPEDSYLWIVNNTGNDFRSQLAATAWDNSNPADLIVKTAFENQDGQSPGDTNVPSLAGARVYVRRLTDVRTVNDRRYALLLTNALGTSRTPVRDYILQTTIGGTNIDGPIPDTACVGVSVGSKLTAGPGGANGLVELRRLNPNNTWVANSYYRPGDVIRRANKHYNCIEKNSDAVFDVTKWVESFVHMENEFNAEDYFKNVQPAIIFDNDTDSDANTVNCGYDLNTVWSTDADIQAQYRSATDYRGLHSFLVSIGFTSTDADTILLPKPSADRDRDNSSSLDGIGNPSGAASAWGPWPLEFRRPSSIRLFNHAWEYSGKGNYSKGLPEYQQSLSPGNQFTYYLSNNVGRCYGSGFNEEGLLVTPQGLQDLQTGTEIGVDGLGAGQDVDQIEFPTFFETLSVDELTVNTVTNLNGAINTSPAAWGDGFGSTLPSLPQASTTQAGIVELATAAETTAGTSSSLAVTPASLAGIVYGVAPIGTVIMYAGPTAPNGWLECDGTAIDAAYTELIALVGSNTPDLRGEFVRGWDNGRGVDAGRSLLSAQDDSTALPSNPFSTNSTGSHTHIYRKPKLNPGGQTSSTGEITHENGSTEPNGNHTHSVNTGGDPETRPRSIALMFIIKHS